MTIPPSSQCISEQAQLIKRLLSPQQSITSPSSVAQIPYVSSSSCVPQLSLTLYFKKTVGLVGWATGGGHGYMTGTFGQGADNILQATLVTPTGEILTANECRNSDIFWAVRGGGGGTFGVLTDLTMKAYPMPSTVLVTVALAQKNGSSSSEFWSSLGVYLAETPRLQAGGVQGYLPVSSSGELLAMGGANFVYNQPKEAVDALFAPVYSRLAKYNDSIDFLATAQDVGSFIDMYHLFNLTEGAGGGGSARTTRLIPAKALTGDMDLLVKTLEKIGPKTGPVHVSKPRRNRWIL